MSKFIVYALIDPRNGEPRYVGKSQAGLRRPRAHLYPSSLRANNHKNNWIKSLEVNGFVPSIVVVEDVGQSEGLYEAEQRWIGKYREAGFQLTNLTDGGPGIIGHVHSEETIAKMSAKSKGRPVSAEARKKLSLTMTGRKRPMRKDNAHLIDTVYSREWLHRMYVGEEKNAGQIARLVGCVPTTVLTWLRKFEVPIKSFGDALKRTAHPGSHAPRPRAKFLDTLQNDEWLLERWNTGIRAAEIARQAGCSHSSVAKRLRKLVGLSRR